MGSNFIYRIMVGEAIVFILFHGPWADQLPLFLGWSGYLGAAILIGIAGFFGDGKD